MRGNSALRCLLVMNTTHCKAIKKLIGTKKSSKLNNLLLFYYQYRKPKGGLRFVRKFAYSALSSSFAGSSAGASAAASAAALAAAFSAFSASSAAISSAFFLAISSARA